MKHLSRITLTLVLTIMSIASVCAQVAFNADAHYMVRHVTSGLYVSLNGSTGANAFLSSTPYYYTIEGSAESGFSLKGANADTYLGANSWNATISSSTFSWTIAESGEHYTLNQQTAQYRGYLGSDDVTENSPLYDNKSTAQTFDIIEYDPLAFSPTLAYTLKHKASGLYVSFEGVNQGSNAVLSESPYAFTLTGNKTDGFTLKDYATGTIFLGESIWNTTASTTAVTWTIAVGDDGFTLHQSSQGNNNHNGFLGADNVDTDRKLYGNKGTAQVFEIAPIPATFTYSYSYNGRTALTEEFTANIGETWPNQSNSLPYGVTMTAPEGTVGLDADGSTKTVATSVSETYPIHFIESATSLSDITEWFTMGHHSNNAQYAYTDGSAISYTTTAPTAPVADTHLWALVGNPFDGFVVYNRASGFDYAITATDNTATITSEKTLFKLYQPRMDGGHANRNTGFCLKPADGSRQYLNYNSGMKYYADNDNGSTLWAASYWQTYNVVVTGPAEGGVTYSEANYHDGETIKASSAIEASALSAIALDNYSALVSLSGHTITVTYTAWPTWTVSVTGTSEGRAIYKEHEYADTETFQALTVDESEVAAKEVAGYTAEISISDHTISAVYTQDVVAVYAVNFDKETTHTNNGRKLTSVTFATDGRDNQVLTPDQNKSYNDLTAQKIIVTAGQTINVTCAYGNGWMHGYVFVDEDKSGEFEVQAHNEAHTVSGDLKTFAFYSFGGPDTSGYNSEGTLLTNGARAVNNPPAFTAPASKGTYYSRFKIDWNSIDPAGALGADGTATGSNGILANSGYIVDFMLEVLAPTYTVVIEGAEGSITYEGKTYHNGDTFEANNFNVANVLVSEVDGYNYEVSVDNYVITVTYSTNATITYVYKNGETEWLRESHAVMYGAKYPELRSMPTGVSITDMPVKILNGTVSTSEELEIKLSVDQTFDVPYSPDYDHATWLYATIHGGSKYFWSYDSSSKRVKTNVTTYTTAKNSDAYKWAIVGNPIIGFKLMNKAAGPNMILTSASPKNDGNSGGNTYPVMTASNDVPQDNNTYWTINTYNGSEYGYLISRDGEGINLNRRDADLAYWTAYDNGSRVGFFPVEETITSVTLPTVGGKTYQYRNFRTGEILTDVSGKTISAGRISGCYHLSSTSTISSTPAVFYVKSDAQWSSLSSFAEWIYEEVPETPVTPESIFNYGDPQYETSISTGKYYRLYNLANAGKLMSDKYNTSGGLLGKAAFSEIESASQVWQLTYTAAETGTEGKYTLRNLLTGRYIGDQPSSSHQFPTVAESSQAKDFVVQKATNDTITYFTFGRTKNGSGLHYAPHQSDNVVLWSVSDNASKWWIDEVTVTEEMKTACEAFYDEYTAKVYAVNNAEECYSSLAPFFADVACTQINPTYKDYTDEQLRTAMASLPTELKDMAVCVKNDQWDNNSLRNYYIKDFRIHDYDIYSDPGVWADKTKVGGFSSLFHPTGITCKAGELLYILVGNDVKDSDAVLEIGIAEATHNGPSQRVELHAGLNIILPNVDGETFVIYRLTNPDKYLKDYPTIKVHFANGEASGCFDMHRGMTNNDWSFLCSNMFTNKYLHIMGEHTVFSVESDRVRGADNICGSLKIWDYIFMTEEKLIGHDGQWDGRYNPVIGARDQYSGNPNWSGTSANYSGIWKDGLLNYNSLLNGDRWVIYHEEAHGHQYPVNLAAMTESSNNGFAQMVNHEFGLSSRRADGTKTLMTFKNDGLTWVDILRGGEGANRGRKYYEESLWLQNHLFYQLYLYFHAQGYMPDFWPRLCDEMRANGGITKSASASSPTLYSNDYLKFARACAEVSKTDLWEFFDAYGFFGFYEDVFVGNDLTAFNTRDVDATATRYVGDYGGYYMRMPSKNNEADKAYLAELKTFMQSQPNKAPNIMFIDDHIKDRTVADSAFAVTLDPSLLGQPVKFYDSGTGRQGDFGDFTDFNGNNEANNIDYTISGNTITVSGEGMVGVKIYDADGNLIRIYNTNTITLDPEKDADIATNLNNGTYTFVAALGNDTNLPLAKPGTTTYAMSVYDGTSTNMQQYQTSGTAITGTVPYSATNLGNDIPVLTGNAIGRFEVAESSLPSSLRGMTNVLYKTGTDTYTAPLLTIADKQDYYAPCQFTAQEARYQRTNIAGWNSVCLPFDVTATDFGTDAHIYVFKSQTDQRVTFEETTAVPAGQFCLVWCEDDDQATWQMTLSQRAATGVAEDGGESVGSFTNQNIGEGKYKLNSDGTAFGATTKAGKVTAFRGYLNMPAQQGVRSFSLEVEELPEAIHQATAPTFGSAFDSATVTPGTDLNGRQTLTFQRGGIYIINGKKTIIR